MIRIALEPEMGIEPGHQWIVVPDTDEGRTLAQLLTGAAPLIQRGGDLLIPHNTKVDERIVNLIDQLAHARYQAPDLIQMTLRETKVEERLSVSSLEEDIAAAEHACNWPEVARLRTLQQMRDDFDDAWSDEEAG